MDVVSSGAVAVVVLGVLSATVAVVPVAVVPVAVVTAAVVTVAGSEVTVSANATDKDRQRSRFIVGS